MQTQIHVTKRDYCDFVIWTEKSLHCERILPDEDFWQSALKRATQFFQFGILPELLCKFYTSVSPIFPTPSRRALQQLCYCEADTEDDDMLQCASPDCPRAMFHERCLGFEGLELTDFNAKRKTWYCPDCSRNPQCKKPRVK